MPLTSDEMSELMLDHQLGRTPRLQTPEAKEFLKNHAEFVKQVQQRGGSVEIPAEHPDLSED